MGTSLSIKFRQASKTTGQKTWSYVFSFCVLQLYEKVRTMSMRITTRQLCSIALQAAESSDPGTALGAIVRKNEFSRKLRPATSAGAGGLLKIKD
jgi:hypothetical protein